MVLPGFIDSHSHPTDMVKQLFAVSLYGLGSIQAYQKAVVDFAKAHPSAKAIRGSGWSNPLFPKTGPDRKMLDVIIKDIPVVLSSEDGHSTWFNSKTLELAGITRKTPNPPGGVDHLVPEDLIQSAVIMAAIVYQTAVREEMLPRRPLPDPMKYPVRR